MYTGYYCKKCKIIPLIKLNITNNQDIKYMVKCKCNINYLTFEEINKKYYMKNIEQKNIINEKLLDDIEDEDSSLLKIKEILSRIENNNKQLSIIKNEIFNFLNEKMEEIEYLYDKTIKINENLEKLILTLINSYECLNSNYSNIKNIKYQTDIDFIDLNDDIFPVIDEKKFYKSIQDSIDLIDKILPTPYEELENISELCPFLSKELKLYNNELLFLQTDDSICIYPLNDLKLYAEISLPSIIKFDIDNQNNIICLFPDYIKIFPNVNYEQIKEAEKENDIIDNIPKLDVKPIIIKKTKMEYEKIIFWGDENDKTNKLIVNDRTCINIFKYDLNRKNFDIIYSLNFELFNNELIKYNNNKALLFFSTLNISLFDLSKLKIIKVLDIILDEEYIITTTQIIDEEVLISQKDYLYILKLNNFQIKLKVKYESDITHIFQLQDKSIIICFLECAKRYSSKTFEMMSVFYNCLDEGFFEKHLGKYYSNYIYITKSIQISSTKVVLILRRGECLLKKLTI